jgi:prevent-host-death family protein
MNWQVREAKARFSEMVERAFKEGPQTVTRHGKAVAVLVPADEYRRLRRAVGVSTRCLQRLP